VTADQLTSGEARDYGQVMSRSAPTTVETVRISTTSGAVRVIAESDRREVTASTGAIAHDGGPVTIDGGSAKVFARVPEGTPLVIGTTSGRVTIEGRVGAVSVVTASGRISVADAASVDARSASGRIEVGHADGGCRVVATSGRVDIGHCGGADAMSESGRIVVSDAHGPVRANCTSGRIQLTMAGAHDVEAETVSGRVEVSFPDGLRPLVVNSPAEVPGERAGHDCVVVARSGAGRVVVSGR
jgi:DUF4097 and DUF4098 domain-containing protein YvlB